MDYISTREAAAMWGISPTRITILANEGRIPGAKHTGHGWMIPKDAAKPTDRRVRKTAFSFENSSADDFSFPFYAYRPDWNPALEAQLSGQELLLLQGQRLCMECRFQKAYTLLQSFQQESADEVQLISYLVVSAVCCIGLNRPAEFSDYYFRLKLLLASDFPHKNDMVNTISILDNYTMPLENIINRSAYSPNVSYQCLPFVCAQIAYAYLAKEILNMNSADVSVPELFLRFLNSSTADLAIEHINMCLFGIYAIRNNTEKSLHHARTVIKLIYEKKHYFTLLSYYRHFAPYLAPILDEYPEDFRQTIHSLATEYAKTSPSFFSAISSNSIMFQIQDTEFPYITAVLQDTPNKLIAKRLGVSQQTVQRRLTELYIKLNVSTKKELKAVLLKYL